MGNHLLDFSYNLVQFTANAIIRALNIGLSLGDTFLGRALHRIVHFPFVVLHTVHNIICAPLRLLLAPARLLLRPVEWVLRPVKALALHLLHLPLDLVDHAISLFEYVIKSKLTPFPQLPAIEFIYGSD